MALSFVGVSREVEKTAKQEQVVATCKQNVDRESSRSNRVTTTRENLQGYVINRSIMKRS